MKKILILEDDQSILEMLEEILANEGYDVYTSMNGIEGISTLESMTPDLILTDVSMPLMDGFDFGKRLLQNPIWKNIPIIAMSAEDQKIDKLELHGLSNFIKKPLEINQLLECLSVIS
jgi:CheY-like chemotaxis protein